MTAEPIAAVVADIRAGRIKQPVGDPIVDGQLLARAQQPQPVVDATAIYRGLLDRAEDGINLYEDFPSVTSPWEDALVCYVNNHGNVMVLQVHAEPWPDGLRWETVNEVDWDRVRWHIMVGIFVGGHDGAGTAVPSAGPIHMWQYAVYEDGAGADFHWTALLKRHDEQVWEMPLATLTATLNFLACSNVEVAEPKRPFPVRQRLRRTRVQVQTIVVRPPGKRRASSATPRPVDAWDSPLTSVRGHFARYGVEGRGLLFGKYAGKFWIPAHARGAGEGDAMRDYVLKPRKAS